MPIMEGTAGLKTWTGLWDFTVDGGLVSTIPLRSNDGPLPALAVVLGGYLDVEVAALSATGTIAVNAEGAGDILAAAAQAALTVGRKSIIPAMTGAASVKTTVPRVPAVTIATAAFTAGKIRVILMWR